MGNEIAELGVGFTYYEVGLLLHRKPKTIKNLVCKHRLPNRLTRDAGRKKIYSAKVSADVVRTLRKIIHGF